MGVSRLTERKTGTNRRLAQWRVSDSYRTWLIELLPSINPDSYRDVVLTILCSELKISEAKSANAQSAKP